MSIIRTCHNKDNPYVMIEKSGLQDPMLSWKAKGLWGYLMSLPDNWQISVTHLSNVYLGKKKGNRRDAIYDVLKELVEVGYMTITQSKDEKGQFMRSDYTIYEQKQIPQKIEKPEKKPAAPKLKKIVPHQDNPQAVSSLAANATLTINNDKEEIFNKNDINVSDSENRSVAAHSPIGFFNASSYRLPDGKPLSQQMQRSIAKYSPQDMVKLRANVEYFENQVKKGLKPSTTYEKWLQSCIKHDYAKLDGDTSQNRVYATFIKEMHGLHQLEVLKTVIKFKRDPFQPAESVPLKTPHEQFCGILDNYIRISENK